MGLNKEEKTVTCDECGEEYPLEDVGIGKSILFYDYRENPSVGLGIVCELCKEDYSEKHEVFL